MDKQEDEGGARTLLTAIASLVSIALAASQSPESKMSIEVVAMASLEPISAGSGTIVVAAMASLESIAPGSRAVGQEASRAGSSSVAAGRCQGTGTTRRSHQKRRGADEKRRNAASSKPSAACSF